MDANLGCANILAKNSQEPFTEDHLRVLKRICDSVQMSLCSFGVLTVQDLSRGGGLDFNCDSEITPVE
jgi:hypothetical protein